MSRYIISISGRKGCGKSEISKIFQKRGFVKLSFADSLKQLICEILNIDIETLNKEKELERLILLNQENLQYISNKTFIDINEVNKIFNGVKFTKIRQLLQFIGTDLIRKYNSSWHIEQTKAKILDGVNYIFDDQRFPNEKEMLDSLGAISFYIIRPANWDISNHESEVSLKWIDFENIFINNIELGSVKKKWNLFIDSLFNPFFKKEKLKKIGTKLDFRKFLIKELKTKTSSEIAKNLGCSRDKIVWWCDKLLVQIPREIYDYDQKAFLNPTSEAAYVCGLFATDGCVKFCNGKKSSLISFTSTEKYLAEIVTSFLGTDRPIFIKESSLGYSKKNTISFDIDCQNWYIVENMKHWDFKPLKQNRVNPPSIIKNDINLLKSWIVGLIDGDGTVSVTKRKSLRILLLATKEICEFIQLICPIPSSICRHKKTFLFQLTWVNHVALDLDRWLDRKHGNPRKWDKIEEFKKLNTKRRTISWNKYE